MKLVMVLAALLLVTAGPVRAQDPPPSDSTAAIVDRALKALRTARTKSPVWNGFAM